MSVVATLVVSANGFTSLGTSSIAISSNADRTVFLARRRKADVIIVGGNTARMNPYNFTPAPLVILSRSLVNPVPMNRLAVLWNLSPDEAIKVARSEFGEGILIEGGISIINELIKKGALDSLELSVTPLIGDTGPCNWEELLSNFCNIEESVVDGTRFFSGILRR